MERRSLRCLPRKSYSELEEPSLDEYVFCEKCADFVYEYCSIHGPLLVIPDDKVPTLTTFPDYVPRAALTIPRVFLHIAPSIIPGAGLGVFSSLTLPRGVRFGPYCGKITKDIESSYCWQIRDSNNKRSHVVDASDAHASNWMRYVNCARHWHEQNLVAYQYQGQIYYRTIKIIPRFTELMVFYGSEFAASLRVDLRVYNSPAGYAQKFGAPAPKKLKLDKNTKQTHKLEEQSTSKSNKMTEKPSTKDYINPEITDPKVKYDGKRKKQPAKKADCKKTNDKNNNKMSKPKMFTIPSKIASSSLTTNETCKLQSHIKVTLICDKCGLIFKCNDTLHFHLKAHESDITEKEHNTEKSQPKDTGRLKQNEGGNKNGLHNHTKKLFICDHCNKTFTCKQSLTRHIRIHKGVKPYKCDHCDKAFSLKHHLNSHIRIHTGTKPYKCDHYDKTFTNKSDLNVHTRTHTGVKPYKCDHCDKTFTQKGHLNEHIRIHTGVKPYKCDHCNKTFTHKGSLNNHISIHTGVKPYKCDHCNKTFTRKDNLNDHIRIHTGVKPYKCDHCDKTFTQKGNLNDHMRIHTGDLHKCEHCGKTFTRKGDLITHIRTHTGVKPYKCYHCDKTFTQKGNLNDHMRIHTGDLHKCEHCGKTFTRKGDLITHIRTHTGVKPYKCYHCDKTFTRKGNLNDHMRIHTGDLHKCEHCGKTFTRKGHLITHIRTHTGEKPYKCYHCDKTFSLKHHLNSHIRIHTGVKPYKCSYCDKAFSDSSYFSKHKKIHTNVK